MHVRYVFLLKGLITDCSQKDYLEKFRTLYATKTQCPTEWKMSSLKDGINTWHEKNFGQNQIHQ